MIDLHTHSVHSDGALPPSELAKKAKHLGLTAWSLTDHDSVGGQEEAKRAAQEYSIPYISGLELTISGETTIGPVDILGYGYTTDNKALKEFIHFHTEEEDKNVIAVGEKLQSLGFVLNLSSVIASREGFHQERTYLVKNILEHPEENAQLLTTYCGTATPDRDLAWIRLVGRKGPAFIPRFPLSLQEAIAIIHEASGIAVWAHPLRSCHGDFVGYFDYIKKQGIDGIEAYYSTFSSEETAMVLEVAKENSLIVTGGSDYHGGGGHPEIEMGVGKGGLCVPDAVWEKLKQ